jgi:uracil-DNA glycosylase
MVSWSEILKDESEQAYYKSLLAFLEREYSEKLVVPRKEDIFKALQLTPLDSVKCVILGQDPYPNPEHACGLAFSVPPVASIPQSLRNIFKELQDDLGVSEPTSGDLTKWALQGVLLLNTVLTNVAGMTQAHAGIGWEFLTNRLIKEVANTGKPVAFILWGKYAQSKKAYIRGKNCFIIESAHPSPLSAYRGFFGSKPFSRVNEFLIKNGTEPIDWNLKEV